MLDFACCSGNIDLPLRKPGGTQITPAKKSQNARDQDVK
jgi:hypothetical protein